MVRDFLAECRQVGRSPWLDQLIAQYFARRRAGTAAENELAFFERELLRELITLTVAAPAWNASSDLLPGTLRNAVDYIEENLFNDLTLEKIGSAAGVSRSSLLRLFKEHLGGSPPDYIRGRRMDEARVLLEGTEKSVSEVAELVSYHDASAFSRAYRRQFGRAPKR